MSLSDHGAPDTDLAINTLERIKDFRAAQFRESLGQLVILAPVEIDPDRLEPTLNFRMHFASSRQVGGLPEAATAAHDVGSLLLKRLRHIKHVLDLPGRYFPTLRVDQQDPSMLVLRVPVQLMEEIARQKPHVLADVLSTVTPAAPGDMLDRILDGAPRIARER